MNNILIKNAVIADENEVQHCKVNILIRDGTVEQISSVPISSKIECKDMQEIDACGNFISPGFIDIHSHLRDPGFTHKEDIESGTKSAVKGGFTAVAAMPNTNPCIDTKETVEYIKSKAEKSGACKVFPIGAITKNQNGDELTDFQELYESGVVAFSDDGKPVKDASVLKNAFKVASKMNALIISHCEEMSLANSGVMNCGKSLEKYNRLYGTDYTGIPNSSEDVIVSRDILLAAEEKARLHIAHISTAESVALLKHYKSRGFNITGETCPHYFTLTDKDVLKYGVNAKMNPPLRSEYDREQIIESIKNGVIDCISTDHAPHTKEEKCEHENNLKTAMNGITGFETAFSLGVTYLVKKKIISLEKLIELMSKNPAAILGVKRGEIKVGGIADFVIFNINEMFTYEREHSHSKSRNTPFDKFELYGKILFTIVNGEIKYKI